MHVQSPAAVCVSAVQTTAVSSCTSLTTLTRFVGLSTYTVTVHRFENFDAKNYFLPPLSSIFYPLRNYTEEEEGGKGGATIRNVLAVILMIYCKADAATWPLY